MYGSVEIVKRINMRTLIREYERFICYYNTRLLLSTWRKEGFRYGEKRKYINISDYRGLVTIHFCQRYLYG